MHNKGDRRDKHINFCSITGECCQGTNTPSKTSDPGRSTEEYYTSFSIREL